VLLTQDPTEDPDDRGKAAGLRLVEEVQPVPRPGRQVHELHLDPRRLQARSRADHGAGGAVEAGAAVAVGPLRVRVHVRRGGVGARRDAGVGRVLRQGDLVEVPNGHARLELVQALPALRARARRARARRGFEREGCGG
jgi:hypothetical protein